MPEYKRVMLKLSGEVLAGTGQSGLDFDAVRGICSELAEIRHAGIELALVVGGGNMIRGRDVQKLGIERTQADYMGMLGTVINALALQDALGKLDVPARVQSAVAMSPVAESYSRDRALRHLKKGRVVIFAAGTGHPFFSTDTAAALRAAEIKADCMLKGTKVDGIYERDPNADPTAKFLPSLTCSEAIQRNIEVMDAAAFSLCRENKIPVFVFNIEKPGRLADILIRGSMTGTLVKD